MATDKIVILEEFRNDGEYIKVTVALTLVLNDDKGTVFVSERLNEMAAWCKESGCGLRTAWNLFEFKTEQELMVFKLRWIT